MSAETKAKLDAAIAAHVFDEQEGAMLTGYVLQTAGIVPTAEDTSETAYLAVGPDGQPFHVGLGLAHFLRDYFTLDNGGDDD